ncbi:integrase [Mesorhizobium amorphae CCNWGS0123]|uniref:Integrase n=1 Tax=Mesorhizobium amorphae CCNWGS0123 TaxID=1082933 RepID=G6YMA7_9HYPH|nr:integrase [Mesorhizobium amorphae CCNWGS0123]
MSATPRHRPLAGRRGRQAAKKKFKSYPIGYFHIDVAEVRTEQGKLHVVVAIDRTSKFAFVELHEKATTAVSRDFLLRLIAAVPYRIHTVLTDNVLSAEGNAACNQGRKHALAARRWSSHRTRRLPGLRVRTKAALTVLNTSF